MSPYADLVLATDRAAQVHLGGASVIYQPAVGGPVTVKGIFDDVDLVIQEGGGQVEQVGPRVHLRLGDLPVHPDNDDPILTIGGVAYKVRERRSDGSVGGGITLFLRRVL